MNGRGVSPPDEAAPTASAPVSVASSAPGSESAQPFSVDDPPRAAGSVLGHYRVLELLGEGGMGRVYLAEHVRLGRKVALKLLRADLASNPKASRRFFSEARAVNQIAHENIIQITDFADELGAEQYYIMEVLHGESLATAERREGALALPRLLHIATQVTNALAAVHDAGMVHRDLKPENIYLVDRDGRPDFVKLLDFGVVKLGNLDEMRLSETAAGAILGTPEYMSPEQVSSNPVDHRTDIYALGVILYEGVTGRKPFAAKSFGEMVVNHLTVKPPKPSALKDAPYPIPARLETLILQCLAKDRDNRPSSMREIEARLREIAAACAPDLAPGTAPRRGYAALVGVGFAAAALAAVAVLVLPRLNGEPAPPASAVTPLPSAAPTAVTVRFESAPAGATVFRQGERTPLGTAPFAIQLERSEQPHSFVFELAGHAPATIQVALSDDQTANAALTPLPAADGQATQTKRPARRSKTQVHRRGTIDPFAED